MKFQIYGREGCANCVSAKRQVHRAKKGNPNIDYEYLNYDEHKEALEAKHGKLPTSLPTIILNGSDIVLYPQLENVLKG